MKKKFFSKLLMVALVATVGAFSSCKDYDDDIADVRNSLTQKATELQKDYNDKIAAVNVTLEKLQTSYDNLSKALDQSNADLKSLIDEKYGKAVTEAKAYSDANLGKAKDAAAAAEAAAKAYAETQAAAAQSAAIAAAKEQVAAAKAELESALAKANELIATQGQSIANLIEADKTLTAAVQAAQARADQAYTLADKANTLAETNKTNLEKAAADITALQTALANLDGKVADKADVAKLQSDLAALQKQVSENVVNLSDYKESITKLTSDLGALKEDLAKQIGFLGENLTAVKKTAEDNVAAIDAIKKQLSELAEANTKAHEQIIASVSALSQTVESNKNAAADALKAAVNGVMAEIAASNKLIGDNTNAIASLTQTVQANKDAQDKINEAIKGDVAQNAKDIAANSKEIKRLNEIIPELEKTLKAYADKVAGEAAQAGKDAAAAAEATAKKYALDEIKKQADLDKEAWNKAIDIAVETLVKTYKLNALDELIKAAKDEAIASSKTYTDAQIADLAGKAQTMSDKALENAKIFAQNLNDILAQNLANNYTNTTDMQAQIEAAKNTAVNQAYMKVLNDLLRDQPDWFNQEDDKKLNELSPTVYEIAMKCVQEFGLSKDNAEELMNQILDAALVASKGTGTFDAEGNEIIEKGGKIMVLIEAAADKAAKDLYDVNDALDARLDKIETFLTTISGEETLDATIKYWITDAKLAKKADLDDVIAQLKGEKDGELKTIINNMKKASDNNAADIQKIMASINKVTGMFASLLPSGEGETIDDQLNAYEKVMKALADKIAAMGEVVDNLDDKVMDAVNRNLGPQIQSMITSINLFANQHMAERDQQYKLRYFNGDEYVYPFGFENFDHELTFVYTVEIGVTGEDGLCSGKIEKPIWNYPAELLDQIQGISSARDKRMKSDYEFSPVNQISIYDPESGKIKYENNTEGFDFEDGRYRSQSDGILVRVSPTNADLQDAWKKGGIALLNSKGEDIVANGLIEVESVEKYQKNSYITRPLSEEEGSKLNNTRGAENNETGLWVIKFKLVEQSAVDFNKYAFAATSKENPKQTIGSIVYAVAVKNTDFSTEETPDVDRYVVSEFDLSLGLVPAKHSWDFDVNGTSVAKIHNRYIQTDEAKNGSTFWTDDPVNYTGTFRYELTWHELEGCNDQPGQGGQTPGETVDPVKNVWYEYCWDCCFFEDGTKKNCKDETDDARFDFNEIAYTQIAFDPESDIDRMYPEATIVKNACDRDGHNFTADGKRSTASDIGEDDLTGIDNRHALPKLLINFSADQAPEGETGEWAKIEIDFPETNDCGDWTPIRGFFVTLDNHFALESGNSEVNAWATYTYKNVAVYNYDQNSKRKVAGTGPAGAIVDVPITLQKGNHGVIYLKNENNVNNGEIIGFRVHAVNYDGTFTDPDGRAFYVEIGKEKKTHKLTFDVLADVDESYAVQNLTLNGEEVLYGETENNEKINPEANGLNSIETYNDNMRAELSSDRFFNRDAYKATYEDAEKYRVVYTWRADNPAIRGYKETSTNAYVPVEGTGYTYGVVNTYGTTGTIIKRLSDNTTLTTYGGMEEDEEGNLVPTEDSYNVEQFFDFWYSTDADATVEGSDKHPWVKFNEADEDDIAAPCMKTNSMRASIKEGMANRLIDGAVYKIKMSIQRKDAQTVWTTVNEYDIDIKKVMPTDLPANFYVKSNQLAGGAWTFYMRPFAEVDFAAAAPAPSRAAVPGSAVTAIDPWAITWGDIFAPTDADNFKALFNADTYTDADGNETETDLHFYRWAMDTRMYNFEGIFNGLYIPELDENGEETGNTTIDQDYYFVFKGAGSYAGAEYDIKKGADEEKADADNADKDAVATFWTEYDLSKVKQGEANADLHKEKGAYTLPLIHWSHVGETTKSEDGKKDVAKSFDVYAGYIYRNISATLNEAGTAFLKPSAEKAGKTGLAITNDDYEIEAVPMKLGTKRDGAQVKATFNCALGTAITLTQKDGQKKEFEYNQNVKVDATLAQFKLASEIWYAADAKKQAYFNTQFDASWTKDNAGTLATWLTKPWCWIDMASLTFTTSAPDGYRYLDYYEKPVFFCGDDVFDPEDNTFQDITAVGMMRVGGNEGLIDLKSDVTGKFTFDIYDVWFHKKTITLNVTIKKPENLTGARQAR